jgi:hypothetical protein
MRQEMEDQQAYLMDVIAKQQDTISIILNFLNKKMDGDEEEEGYREEVSLGEITSNSLVLN